MNTTITNIKSFFSRLSGREGTGVASQAVAQAIAECKTAAQYQIQQLQAELLTAEHAADQAEHRRSAEQAKKQRLEQRIAEGRGAFQARAAELQGSRERITGEFASAAADGDEAAEKQAQAALERLRIEQTGHEEMGRQLDALEQELQRVANRLDDSERESSATRKAAINLGLKLHQARYDVAMNEGVAATLELVAYCRQHLIQVPDHVQKVHIAHASRDLAIVGRIAPMCLGPTKTPTLNATSIQHGLGHFGFEQRPG